MAVVLRKDNVRQVSVNVRPVKRQRTVINNHAADFAAMWESYDHAAETGDTSLPRPAGNRWL